MYVGLWVNTYRSDVQKYDFKAHTVVTTGFTLTGFVLKCLDILSQEQCAKSSICNANVVTAVI